MKKNVYAAALAFAGLVLTSHSASAQVPDRRTCASDDVLKAQLAADPGLAQRMATINNQALQYAAQKAGAAQRGTAAVTVTIPVVVHVLYSTASQNISTAQIQSQIDVLNEDFHLLNADANKVPAPFASRVADVGIQFVLAKRDPNGLATTGIERKSSTTTAWGTSDRIKRTSTGGLNAWPAGQYLNLWVGNIGSSILGYAQFPGGPAATDGVVISPVYFGRTGTATAPFNLGRTGSHEVGHWLNLFHIWGDDDGACTGSDEVADTPNQADARTGKPAFPQVSCSNGPNGDMFMDYMDYTDDAAMFMFSTGQSNRMNALFAAGGARASLLTSPGGVAPGGGGGTPPPTAVAYCASSGNSVAYEYINLVQLGSINRSSGADGGYYNGTALSTSLGAGSSQTISYRTGFTGAGYAEYFRIYADWNQDGDFLDAGENLVSSTNTAVVTTTRSASFTVPASARSGNTRLRVVMSDNPGTTSCGSYNYGETEDYTLTVTGGARTDGSTARLGSGGLADQYTLFPNPAVAVLRIARPSGADPEQPFTVRVHDVRGAEIKVTLTEDQLDVAALRAGTYLLIVSDGRTTTHQRFVKE